MQKRKATGELNENGARVKTVNKRKQAKEIDEEPVTAGKEW